MADVLNLYFDNSEIVYVKSRHVSDFRHENAFLKVREANDYHHAKDAYLNIVVGNVYHTKFTKSPMNFIREKRETKKTRPYSLNTLFKNDVKRDNTVAWIAGIEGTIDTVTATMRKDTIQFTRLPYEETGAFYDEMPLKKGKGQIPLKTSDDRMHNTERYGAYNNDYGAYFILVEHSRGKKKVKTLEYVPIRIAARLKEEAQLLEYCKNKPPFGLGLENPRILIRKIKKDTLFKIQGFPSYISSRTGTRIELKAGIQLKVPYELLPNFKRIGKFIQRKKANKNKEIKITPYDQIDRVDTLACYDLLTTKANETIWNKRPNLQGEFLRNQRTKFMDLTLEEQCEVVMNVLQLFNAGSVGSGGTDLRLLGGAKSGGTFRRSNNFTNDTSAVIVHQSITGLFETCMNIGDL